MSLQVQATVVNVNGSDLSPSQSLSFPIENVWLQETDKYGASTVLTLDGGAKYYASEAIGSLVATGLVQVTVLQVDNAPQVSSLQMAFPASRVDIQSTTAVSGANSVVTFNGSKYYVSETESTLVTAANAGGGGGGVESVEAAANQTATVDNTDPLNPIISSGIRVATVTLTDEQIKALPTTGVEIVAAPGVGKVIKPIAGVFVLNTTFGAYTNTTGATWNLYVGGNSASSPSIADAALGSEEISVIQINFPAARPGSGDYANALITLKNGTNETQDNQPMILIDDWNGVTDYEDGNPSNTLKVTVYYVVVDL